MDAAAAAAAAAAATIAAAEVNAAAAAAAGAAAFPRLVRVTEPELYAGTEKEEQQHHHRHHHRSNSHGQGQLPSSNSNAVCSGSSSPTEMGRVAGGGCYALGVFPRTQAAEAPAPRSQSSCSGSPTEREDDASMGMLNASHGEAARRSVSRNSDTGAGAEPAAAVADVAQLERDSVKRGRHRRSLSVGVFAAALQRQRSEPNMHEQNSPRSPSHSPRTPPAAACTVKTTGTAPPPLPRAASGGLTPTASHQKNFFTLRRRSHTGPPPCRATSLLDKGMTDLCPVKAVDDTALGCFSTEDIAATMSSSGRVAEMLSAATPMATYGRNSSCGDIGGRKHAKQLLTKFLPRRAKPDELSAKLKLPEFFTHKKDKAKESEQVSELEAAHLFGTSLERLYASRSECFNAEQVPIFLVQCADIVLNRVTAEGVFRVTGSRAVVECMRKVIETTGLIQLVPEFGVYEAASLLSLFFRELPEPLLTPSQELYAEAVTFGKSCADTSLQEDEQQQLSSLSALLARLPPVHRSVTRWLVLLLHQISEHNDTNKMTADNLGMVFSPSLSRQPELQLDLLPTQSFMLNAQTCSLLAESRTLQHLVCAIVRLAPRLFASALSYDSNQQVPEKGGV
eukprot:TRINITY_DN1311_c0_g1_i2.p1 TRINITY_DN1311_c0_g1~~TRINITY_DN1311_c0_g1_i2.p1  ORF type:complete len:622 (+),score=151.21 TRINITY_DN1311_c0_g1_i2:48-1913(+)